MDARPEPPDCCNHPEVLHFLDGYLGENVTVTCQEPECPCTFDAEVEIVRRLA